MSESCAGCFESARGQQIEQENVIKKATAYAQEQKKSVAIYKEGNEYKFIDAFFASNNGIPIIRVVSVNSKTSP